MKVLEVNVDDLQMGGVFSLVKNIVINNKTDTKIDIGAIEKFESEDNIALFKKYGSEVYYIGYEGNKIKKQIKCYFNLIKLLNENRYDCVHLHSDVAYKILAPTLASRKVGIKKIIIHSHAAGVDGNYRFIKKILHKACAKVLKKLATNYVACSDLAAAWMFPGVEGNKIEIINNGVNLEKFRFDAGKREEIRKKLNLNNKIVVGHVGRFAYQKNHEYLIRIIENVKTINPNTCLLLIGEGPDENRIHELVKEKKLENSVIFYGTTNRVNDLFQAMDVFILPSHFEGLPIVGVEAQASGLPVLFSDKITREAKITDNVEFIDITEKSTATWVKKIEDFSEIGRTDTFQDLKNKKFSIQDTVESFLNLYETGE